VQAIHGLRIKSLTMKPEFWSVIEIKPTLKALSSSLKYLDLSEGEGDIEWYVYVFEKMKLALKTTRILRKKKISKIMANFSPDFYHKTLICWF